MMDKQKKKKYTEEEGEEREMLRFGWMRGWGDRGGVGSETVLSPSDRREKPVAGFQRGSRVSRE